MGLSCFSTRFFRKKRKAESVFDLPRRAGQLCKNLQHHRLLGGGENMNQTEEWFYRIICFGQLIRLGSPALVYPAKVEIQPNT